MIEERIFAAKQYVKTLFADRADGHDVEHTLRVYTNAMRIAQAEGPCDLEIVGLSALLHDADDRSCRNCANFFLWWPQRETPY